VVVVVACLEVLLAQAGRVAVAVAHPPLPEHPAPAGKALREALARHHQAPASAAVEVEQAKRETPTATVTAATAPPSLEQPTQVAVAVLTQT
jgi:hypothetical protein